MGNYEEEIKKIPEFVFLANLYKIEEYNDTDIHNYLINCPICNTLYSIRPYICKIVKNFNENEERFNNDSYEKYCRYFKYWVYYQRIEYLIKQPNNRDLWDECITCIFHNLKGTGKNSGKICKWDNNSYSNTVVGIRRYVDKICSVRDKLGGINKIKSDREMCLVYNKYTYRNMMEILSLISGIRDDNRLNGNDFIIDGKCSLEVTDLFFPDDICPTEKNIQDREPQNCSCEYREPPACEHKECTLPACPNVNVESRACTLDECRTHKESMCPKVEENKEINKDEKLQNNPVIHVGTSVFLSIFGTIFVFFFLYKYTYFGPWLHKKFRKSNVLKKQMDKRNTAELFQGASRFVESNYDDSRHFIGYDRM
ncbi:PIR protein [Plasmodium vivax]|uniref:VIR protein n=1 Tax=Plasmodium vivax TaxID=5855 RepID=A0A564ZMX5_PLAVI|nr:PIR protein [Plasmodium vivax]